MAIRWRQHLGRAGSPFSPRLVATLTQTAAGILRRMPLALCAVLPLVFSEGLQGRVVSCPYTVDGPGAAPGSLVFLDWLDEESE